MKKSIVISIFAFAIAALSCSKIYDVSEPQANEVYKSKEQIDKEAIYYATVVRDMIRFDALSEQFTIDGQLSKGRIGGNDKQSIVDSKVNEIFENIRKTKGDKFFNDAKKIYAHPLMNTPVSLKPLSVINGNYKKDNGNRKIEMPKYLVQNLNDFRKHVLEKIDKFAEKIEKKSDIDDAEYLKFVKNTVSDFEDKVIKDKKLTQDQRAEIFIATSTVFANAETICKISKAVLEEVTITKGMRVKGFFRSLVRILGTIIHDVVAGVIAGALIGALGGVADIGGVIGGVVGLVWGIVDAIQGDCLCWDFDCLDGGCSGNFYDCPC